MSLPAAPEPDTDYVCSKCDMPVAQINGTWQHAEPADATACAIFNGSPLAGGDDNA